MFKIDNKENRLVHQYGLRPPSVSLLLETICHVSNGERGERGGERGERGERRYQIKITI